MQLRTTFDIAPSQNKITHQNKLLAVGSCFAAMIGKRLKERKYDISVNPFGTIFNPVSLFQLMEKAITGEAFNKEDIISHQDKYLHYQYHSDVCANSASELQSLIHEINDSTKQYLNDASHLFITLGTAFAYRHVGSSSLVANCHKQPSSLFNKDVLSLQEMESSFLKFYGELIRVNPKINIIITVSPVRHTKDGIPENQLSKSLLVVFANQLSEQLQNIRYFPSYELMMDDLRDYRFYKEDMIHPTEQAEKYIWDKFTACFIHAQDQELDAKISSILDSLSHKPFHPASEAHQAFLHKLVEQIKQMPDHLDFSGELKRIEKQLL